MVTIVENVRRGLTAKGKSLRMRTIQKMEDCILMTMKNLL